MNIFCLLWGLVLSLLSLHSFADIKLPYLIGDGMVVQRFEPIPIWGWALPHVDVKITFANETKRLRSDESGYWFVQFSARKEGGPYGLSIQTPSDTKSISNILVGDVWVCSGQSNMEWLLRDADNADVETPKANDTQIRHFKVPKSWSVLPENELSGGKWQVSSPQTAPSFTAIGYFFAKEIRKHVDVPIGLLHSSWGGSNIESWMSASSLDIPESVASKRLSEMVAKERLVQTQVQARVAQWPDTVLSSGQGLDELAQADWSAIDLDESDWVSMTVPGLWENNGFSGLDGVAWYRKHFTLSKNESRDDLVLNLARIDDIDTTWVNGVKVGSAYVYSHDRRYHVLKSILKPGRNVIAIRVVDSGGGGGIYSDAKLSIEQKTKLRSLAGKWMFKVDKGVVTLAGNKNHTPTALYNKMLNPLFNVPVKGVLWYQGESNASSPDQAFEYRSQFKKLIGFWREQWHKPTLPFYWVQLANYESGVDVGAQSPWAILRESQSEALSLPHTGQAITIDVGNPDDIHPRNKQSVGQRLAYIALNQDYGKKAINPQGPTLINAVFEKQKVVLNMLTPKGLTVRSSSGVLGFTISGKDKVFYPAQAKLEGSTIVLWSEKVQSPLAARYAWSDNPVDANLVDLQGLPVGPFRTDRW